MPEKVLNTRIQLKYDTLENWNTNNPVLKAGEVGIATVPDPVDPIRNAPAVVFKVGDGTTAWNDLKFGSALAADVYSWAKAATKPTYTAGEVGAATAADITAAIQALDSNAAVAAGNFITGFDIVDGKVTNVQYGAPAEVSIPEYTLSSDSEGNVTITGGETNSTVAINGFSEVAGLARSAVQTVADGTANGTILVDGEAVSVGGLGSAAYTNANAYATAAQGTKADTAVQPGDLGTAAEANVEDFATAAQGGKADTAVQNVQSTGSGVATGFTKSGTNIAVTLSQITDAMVAADANIAQSKINGLTSALSEINASIANINTDIEGLGNALHFAGAGATLPLTGEDGDVYVITSGEDAGKEYIWANGGWQEFGDTSDYLLASTAQATYVPKTTTVAGHALNTSAIEITAGDVGADPAGTAASLIAGLTDTLTNAPAANSTVTAFDQVGGKVSATFAPIAIAASQITSGTLAAARIPTLEQSKVNGLSNALTNINAAIANVEGNIPDVSGFATKTELSGGLAEKQDTLTSAQLNAVNSGITAAKVDTYDGYATNIATLEAKPGLDKVGTVTTVAAGTGLAVTGNASATPTIGFDDTCVFIFNCGNASTLVD